jgi:signal peptidase II
MQNKYKVFKKYLGTFIILLIVDQLIKFVLIIFFPEQVFKNLVGIFNIGNIFYIILFTILMVIVLLFLFNNKKDIYVFPFQFILAGAFSNLLDKVFRGYVIDFIPVFNGYLNLADLFIIFGLLIILLNLRKTSFD